MCTDWARRSPAAAPTPLRPEVERGGRSAEARPAPEPSERPRMAGVPGYRGGRGRWARGGARVPLRPRPPGCIGRVAPRCLGARTGPRRPGFAAALAPGPGGTAAGRAVGSGRLEGRLPGPEMLRLWTRRRGEGPSRWRGPPAGEREGGPLRSLPGSGSADDPRLLSLPLLQMGKVGGAGSCGEVQSESPLFTARGVPWPQSLI